jgi:hypothetical protein
VQEAIAYCESNPPEIAQDFAREEALMHATGMNDPDYNTIPSRNCLRRKSALGSVAYEAVSG